jgi:hypothetical protein
MTALPEDVLRERFRRRTDRKCFRTIEGLARKHGALEDDDQLQACVILETHKGWLLWFLIVFVAVLPGIFLAWLCGLTKVGWLLVTQREVIVTRATRRHFGGLRKQVLRLDRPVQLTLLGKPKQHYVRVIEITLPEQIAVFFHRRAYTLNGVMADVAFRIAATPGEAIAPELVPVRAEPPAPALSV